MEIKGSPSTPPSSANPATTVEGSATPALANVRVGQTLQAVVLTTASNQTALLQLNNQQLRVETQAPLSTGQHITIEVVQIKPEPVLRLQALPPSSTTQAAEQAISAALKQTLPKQMGFAPLLANLNLLNQSQQASTLLAPLVMASIKKVMASLPQRSQVTTSEGLKTALNNSGIFLENKLKNATVDSNTGRDIKTVLLQLMAQAKASAQGSNQLSSPKGPQPPVTAVSAVRAQMAPPMLSPAPPQRSVTRPPQPRATPTLGGITNLLQILGELGKQTEGALARLMLHQLASLPQQDQTSSLWMFELPVQHREKTDLFQFTLQEEEREKKDQNQTRHSIVLSFDIEGLGPMHVKLSYAREQVFVTVWAQKQSTATLVQQEIKTLSRRFKKAGVEVGHLRCQHGVPPEPAITCIHQTVLDINV